MSSKTRTFIWIRHAMKEYANSKGPDGKPVHDPDILPNSKDDIDTLASYLVENYGLPVQIIVSPYLRTRNTAKQMVDSLELKNSPKIIIEPLIGEFLGWQKDFKEPVVSQSTKDLNCQLPPIGETLEQLEIRAQEHLRKLREEATQPGTYWIISHGIFISTIRKLLLNVPRKHVKPLNFFIYTME